MSNEPIMIIRAQRRSGYFLMSRDTAQNKAISYDALGMLAYLLSKPDDWEVRPSDLVRSGCKRNTVYKVLKELMTARHVRRVDRRTAKGQFIEHVYEVYELPEAPEPLPKKPDLEKPDLEKQTQHITEFTEKRVADISAATAKERPNIFLVFEQNISVLTPMIVDSIKDWQNCPAFNITGVNRSDEAITKAIEEAVGMDKRNWKYIEAILKRYEKEGIDSPKPSKQNLSKTTALSAAPPLPQPAAHTVVTVPVADPAARAAAAEQIRALRTGAGK